MLQDFLFEYTDYSEYEGEQFLVECESIEEAWDILIERYGFNEEEVVYIDSMSVTEGEMLGLDTY